MHLSKIAQQTPQKPAYIMAASGQTVTYEGLEAGSNQLAQLFRSLGLARGDHIAILLENHPLFLQICVAAQRAGIYYTAISYRLQSDEVEYIVNDCGARVFITSIDRRAVVEPLIDRLDNLDQFLMLDGVIFLGLLHLWTDLRDLDLSEAGIGANGDDRPGDAAGSGRNHGNDGRLRWGRVHCVAVLLHGAHTV